MSEDALFDAEFDRIRDGAPIASTVSATVHSLPHASQTISLQQPPNNTSSAQQQLRNLSLHKSDNINQTHRQAPPLSVATSRPRADPFQSAPFPLAPKYN